jgi:transcription factor SPN1
MSQTQPELTAAVNDLFGDSDDDDDDLKVDSDDEPAVVATATATPKSTNDDDDGLFESDDDEISQPVQKRSRLMKSDASRPAAKKQRVSESSSRPSKPAAASASLGDDQSDPEEYDSEEDVVRTKEDDEFLDQDDDDVDLLKEYENDTQDFHDDRPEYSRPLNRGGAGGVLPSQTSTSSSNVETDPLSQAMADMKKKKKQDMTESQKGDIALEVLQRMDKAFNDDKLLVEREQPAVQKLKLLPHVKKMLTVKQMQTTLLDYDLLSVLKSWVEPGHNGALPSLTVRTTIYELLLLLPCHSEHIKRSGIGKTLVALCKSETPANKQKIKEIIEKWSRPIFGKSVDARSMDIRGRMVYETQDETRRRREQAIKHSPRAADANRVGIDSVLEGTAGKVSGDNGFDRVRCPTSNGFMFTARPASAPQHHSSHSKKDDEKGARSKLGKRLTDLKASTGKGNFRLVSAAVSGRDKA